jgi:serine/threonine-protein kinase
MAWTVGASLRRLLEADAALSPADAATWAEERTAYNVRLVRWILTPGLVGHAVFLLVLRAPGATPEQTVFLRNAFGINVVLTVAACALCVLAWLPGSPRVTPLQRRLGDLVVVAYVTAGALFTANAQRVNSTMQMFLLLAVVSVFFRPRGIVHAAAILAGLGIVSLGVALLQTDALGRRFNVITAFMFCGVATAAFGSIERFRARELTARAALARLNADLERRVDEQVHEIVAHAREIEQLNGRLAEKVRERSRELSQALARIAGGGERELEAGAVLGERVVIESRLGAGGMGVVYRGFDRVANARVAVKLVQASSASELDALHRFLREAQAMATVRHPAVVRSLHVDVSEDGLLFQVMELVEGETLDARLRSGGALPQGIAARAGALLAEALAAAHDAGVVHCDVKPSNVMLTRTAPGLKLLDFGVSKLRDARSEVGSPSGAFVIGTPQFMAPEQFTGRESVTDRTDVYALGLVVYECLTGGSPFRANTLREWFTAHASQDARDVRADLPEVDERLAEAVMTCLRKEPEARPRASEVASALAAIADAVGGPPLERVDWALVPAVAALPHAATVVSGGRARGVD